MIVTQIRQRRCGRAEKTLAVAAAALCAALLLVCTNPQQAGNSSETGNGVTAMLRNPGGSPAAHATVRFYPVNFNPRTGGLGKILATVDSTVTNANGNYTANLDTGSYNVLASGDSGVVYQDSIKVTKDSAINPPTDTLKAPGSLRGVIRMEPGDDARKVFIIAMGTNTLTEPQDSVGNFALANMAQGSYSVRILSVLDNYGVLDTSLAVRAGKNDTLADTIVLPYTGIPVPSGLKISYDTLKQIVNLSWNKPTTGRTVKGYNIYRMNVDSNTTLATINPHLVTDTVYSDSTGVQDLTYQYRVTAVDTSGTEGVKGVGVSVKIQPAYALLRRFSYSDSTAIKPIDIEVDKNGSIFILDKYAGLSTKVVKFNSNYVQDFGWGTKVYDGEPDLAIDSLNRILIINPAKSRIEIYLTDGTLTDSIANAGVFSTAFGIVGGYMDVVNGKIFVLGADNNMKMFDYSGSAIDSMTLPYFGYFKVSSAGSIFMSYENEILQITSGSIVNRWGKQGTGIGEFQYARQLYIDSNRKIYAVDEKNNRIQAFDLLGNFYLRFSLTDFYNFTPYSSPAGICISPTSNDLLVGTDSLVLVFSRR